MVAGCWQAGQTAVVWESCGRSGTQGSLFKIRPDLHLDFVLSLALWKFILEYSQAHALSQNGEKKGE